MNLRHCLNIGRPWAILGLLRFMFALWVFICHTHNFAQSAQVIPALSENALVAIYCFLAISGYSICHSLSAKPQGFLLRRFWRITPIYILTFLLAVLVYLVCGTEIKDGFGNLVPFPSIYRWIGCALLLQAVIPVYIDVLFPLWSLSVEIIYYFLAPIFIRKRVGLAILAVIFSCAFCLIRPNFSSIYIGLDTYGFPVAAMIWAWLAGWFAYLRSKNKLFFFLFLMVGYVCIYADPLLNGWFNYFVWTLTITIEFFVLRELNIGDVFNRIFRYLGELSFPLYMIHYPILFLLLNSIFKVYPSWNTGSIQIAVVISVAIFVTSFIDLPLRRYFQVRTQSNPNVLVK